MNNEKKIWYGTNGNNVAFAENETALTNAGVTNPRSFTVNGDVSGLNLIGNDAQSSSSPQTA